MGLTCRKHGIPPCRHAKKAAGRVLFPSGGLSRLVCAAAYQNPKFSAKPYAMLKALLFSSSFQSRRTSLSRAQPIRT